MNIRTIFQSPKQAKRAPKITLADMSPTSRALLTTDGSFTLLLEAFTGEKIVAQPIRSGNIQLTSFDRRVRLLQVSKHDDLLFRSALLKTSESGATAAYVEAI